MIKPVLLWTDLLVYFLILAAVLLILWTRKQDVWREQWIRVGQRKLGMISLVILLSFSFIGVFDSIHFKRTNHYNADPTTRIQGVQSVLDLMLLPLGQQDEQTYSAPFSIYLTSKEISFEHGVLQSYFQD